MNTRPIANVLVEALVIGLMNATLIFGINRFNMNLAQPNHS